jgi:HK97 family phage prohead protease
MTELLTTTAGGDLSVRSEDERIIEARLLRWGDVAQTRDGPERFARGSFRGTDPRNVGLEAIGPHGQEPGVRLVGRASSIVERDDGPYGEFRVARTRDGDELLELVRDGVYSRVSVVFEPVQSRRIDGVTERQRVNLVRVGVVERGAYPAAEVVAVRSAGEPEMPTETREPVPPAPDPEPEPDPTPVPGGRVTQLARRADNGDDFAALRAEMLGRMVALEARGPAAATSPLARYDSLAAYLDAAWSDREAGMLLARALVDQTTGINPGVMQPAWMLDVRGIIARPRVAINALGGPASLGSEGMVLNWPYLDPALDLDAVIAVQAAQKTEINSVLVKILTGSAPIVTWAGGSDVSYQLIRRSSPSYVEAYNRVLANAYARETEAAFEVALEAGSTQGVVIAAGATADQVRAAYFTASALVEAATGEPATVALASPTEFARLGGLPGLFPSQYGTQNIAGTVSAATLQINVSGLPVLRAPYLTGQETIITNGLAARFHEDGPFPISAEDVAKLGRNIAIWGMGATEITYPKGIVKSTLTTELSADEEAASSSRRK